MIPCYRDFEQYIFMFNEIFVDSSELPALLLRSDDEMKKVTEARAAAILCEWVRDKKNHDFYCVLVLCTY